MDIPIKFDYEFDGVTIKICDEWTHRVLSSEYMVK
jgi:hypothetical protein